MLINFPPTPGSLLRFLLPLVALLQVVSADPIAPRYNDCSASLDNQNRSFNVSSVYAQILNNEELGDHLNLFIFGSSPEKGIPQNDTNTARLYLSTTALKEPVIDFQNKSLCESLLPPSPIPLNYPEAFAECPMSAGPFAISAKIPWDENYALTTLRTQVAAIGAGGNTLMCIIVHTTPLPGPNESTVFGNTPKVMLWSTISLFIAYAVLDCIAKAIVAWSKVDAKPVDGLWERTKRIGRVVASVLSGEHLAASPALLRFNLPSARDVIFHSQYCAMVAVIAVDWPEFVYPILAQTAWSTLSFNASLTNESKQRHWNYQTASEYSPPTYFIDQVNQPNSTIFIDRTTPNLLFSLPKNSKGISSFAYTVGIAPQDLFSTCLILFLGLLGVLLVLTVVFATIHCVISLVIERTPPNKADDSGSEDPHHSIWTTTALHLNILHGNVVHLFVLFYLPVTVFSTYQMTISHGTALVPAAVSFALVSIVFPVYVCLRLARNTEGRLYSDRDALLSLGTLKHHFIHRSLPCTITFFVSSLCIGVSIGAAQGSALASASMLLFAEVLSAAVVTRFSNAEKLGSVDSGLSYLSAARHLARFTICVFLFLIATNSDKQRMKPLVGGALRDSLLATSNSGNEMFVDVDQVALGALAVLGLIYLGLLLLVLCKLIELVVRMLEGIGFNKNKF